MPKRRDWSGKLLRDDMRRRYGTPPTGNANNAWIQHFIHHLAPPNGRGGGLAGFVMANGSLPTSSGGEGEARRRIFESDRESRTLAEMRDYLLFMLLSGQVGVGDAL